MHKLLGLLILLSSSVFSQSIDEMALPHVTHYDTKNMGFNTQSWGIQQGEDGLVYITNGSKILVFDGAKWRHIDTKVAGVVRSVFVKNKDSIYFGADGQHGLLTNKGYNDFELLPLKSNAKDVVSDVEEYWRTHNIDNEIIFQTFRNLYVNQGNIVTKIPAPYRFKWSYKVDEDLYVNDLKYGVFKLKETNLLPVISNRDLNENIVGVTKNKDDLIIITDTKGLYRVDNEKLVPVLFNASEEIKKAQIFSFLKLRDGRIAIGTVSNGLYILDLATGQVENINKRSGLQNNTILSIYQDNEDNLWLALDYGVDYLKLNSPLKYYYDYYGELGTTYAVIKEQNKSYIGTNQGLYLIDNTIESNREFELLLNGQVWNIEKVDDKIFVGHDKGAFFLEGKTLTRLGEDLGGWNFRGLQGFEEDVVVSGNYNGISIYQNIGGDWEAYSLKGFEKSARNLEVDKNNNIWVALHLEGVFKFELDFKEKVLRNPVFYPLEKFGGEKVALSKVDGKIIVTSNSKSYTYSETSNNFVQEELGADKGDAPRIIKKNDHTWYLENNRVVVQDKNRVVVLDELKDQLIFDVLNVFSLDNKNEIIPVFDGFSMYTKNYDYVAGGKKNDLLIRDFVSVNSGESYADGAEIPFSDNNLKVDYALPIYGKKVLYQTKMDNGDWSDWTSLTEKTFYNLSDRDYNFYIRAKYNGDMREASLGFKIKPPIYRTVWAYLLYLLLFVSLLFFVFSINRYKMKKQERILLEQKADKLRLQEEKYQAQEMEQQRKIVELKNAKLQDEVKAKSRELTQIAYVNLNKNKILKKIRDKVVKVQSSTDQKLPTNSYNELIRLVEYYITDKESEIFEINFDKSHQEFYEKLSKNYPDLTSKDLRLCAYLKMNLSSKEIAPLLGISAQSVDVSRHRLRKKLNLGSKDNLTNILISLK